MKRTYKDINLVINKKIIFEANKPFKVKLKQIKRYPIHLHEDVTEILLPIKGSINVITNHEHVFVKEGDFIFINNNSIHSIQSSEASKAIVAVFHIDLNFFEKKYEYIKNMYFRSNMYSKEYEEIRSDNFDYKKKESKTMFKNKLVGILIDTVFKHELSDEITSLYEKQIIESMVNEFNWIQFLNKDDINPKQLERYHRIVKYIQEHIYEKITLDDITNMENISKNYFSHFWKNISNFSFVERVNFEKVLKSEYTLLSTDKNIVSISKELSFSDVKYYYNHFKRWYGCTPLEYRNRCFKYMDLEMEYSHVADKEAEAILDNYLNFHSISSFKSLYVFSEDISTFLKQLFLLDKNYFSKNIMSIVLDLFKYIKIENNTIEINRYVIYQIILLTEARNLGLTIKIDFSNFNTVNHSLLDVLNNFFKFSLFHFNKDIIEKWDYFIKYNEDLSLDYISKIKTIVQSNVENATFKYYLEI